MVKFLISILLLVSMVQLGQALSKLSALRQSVFLGYDKQVTPEEPVSVQFGMNLLNLDLCPHKQILTTHAWIQMKWTDPRLKWNPEDWNGVTMLRIEPSLLWIPDIVPYNGEQSRPNFITVNDNIPNVIIFSSGDILFVPPVTQRTFCPINYDNYPWGEQSCTIVFGSWTYSMDLVDIVAGDAASHMVEGIDYSLFKNPLIEIVSTSYNRTEALYPCCTEKYPNLALTVVFKQKAIFHHEKLLTQETEAALHAKHGKHGGHHKHESSEENN